MRFFFFLVFLCNSLFGQNKQDFTLEEIFKKSVFTEKSVYGFHSMNDGKSYVVIERDATSGKLYVGKRNYSDGKLAAILYSEQDLIYKNITLPISTDFNDDESKVLISKDEESIYRHSFRANYFVFDIRNKTITEVSSAGKQMHATFSPDGNKIAFVRDNNVFIKDLTSLQESQITFDGRTNHIINGSADWVYEEEFSFTQAFFWSPDSKKIAFYRFDETNVPEFSMTLYNKLYPSQYVYKYPKAGEKNSIVSIHVYDLAANKTSTVDVGKETDQYIPRIRWTKSSNLLCVLRLNRQQNQLDYILMNTQTGSAKVILTEQDKYYIDIEKEQLTFLANGKQFINASERDGYNHLYLYDLNGKMIKQITKGSWEVTAFYGIDEKNDMIYYQSTEKSPLRRDLFSIRLNGKDKKGMSLKDGTNEAVFSKDFSYFLLTHTDIATPAYVTLHDKTGKELRVLEDNGALKERMKQYNIPMTTFFSFNTTDGNSLNGYMIKPTNFDPDKKYPVLMYVYGGPGHQLVADSWSTKGRDMWLNYIAQKGYLVVCVDNRGTGYRGAEFKKMTYKQLGKYETIDQIEAAKWLAKQPYVDGSRIGIWGWSFGGYMASLCITKGADIFKMAIAVAPVTTWRYYDSIYTERFLGTPQENPTGYDDNSPINFVDKLKGKFLLVHGTGDDNVHFQNSVMLSEAFIQANKPFEQTYYPNKNHGISGGNTSLHLYSKMTDFILQNL